MRFQGRTPSQALGVGVIFIALTPIVPTDGFEGTVVFAVSRSNTGLSFWHFSSVILVVFCFSNPGIEISAGNGTTNSLAPFSQLISPYRNGRKQRM